jgi:phage shock protein PspC (stress-responsive transcriptional regulator)
MTISTSSPLSRYPTGGYFAGICEGLGRHYGINPTLVRIAWLAAVFVFGTGLALYLVLWAILPEHGFIPSEPAIWEAGPDGVRHPPLRRTLIDRKLLGVCGGVARRWDLDPSLVRLGTVALAIASFGVTALGYLAIALFLPAGPKLIPAYSKHPRS